MIHTLEVVRSLVHLMFTFHHLPFPHHTIHYNTYAEILFVLFYFQKNDEASTYLVFCLLMFIKPYLLLFPLSLHRLLKCSLFFQTALIHLLCWDLCFQAYFSINSDVPRLCALFILSVFKWKWQNRCPCFIKYSLAYFYSVLRNSHIAYFSGECFTMEVPW